MRNELTNTTIWRPGPLTLADIAAIARLHSPLIATLIDTTQEESPSEHELAMLGGQLLCRNSAIYESIVSAGCGQDQSDAAALSMISKGMLALKIIHLTVAEFEGQPLWETIRAEIQPASSHLGGSCH